jgi:hypothetical protein
MSAASAYLDLARSALDQGDAGTLPTVDALGAAEIFARLASGHPDSWRILGLVMLRRRDEAARAGDTHYECMFGSMAMARLDLAADAGDELAAEMLTRVNISPDAMAQARAMLAGSYRQEAATEDEVCRLAGKGDEAALNTVLDEVTAALHNGIRPARDALHLALTVARVGESFGHRSLCLRLVGVLILLGQIDRQEGQHESGLACEVGAIVKLADLAAESFSTAEERLEQAIYIMSEAAFAAAAHRPSLIDRLPHLGSCQ